MLIRNLHKNEKPEDAERGGGEGEEMEIRPGVKVVSGGERESKVGEEAEVSRECAMRHLFDF